MIRRHPLHADRRTVLKLAPLALAGGHDLFAGRVAAADPSTAVEPKLAPDGDPIPTGGKRLDYLDPAINAVVVIDGTTVGAYRYKAA